MTMPERTDVGDAGAASQRLHPFTLLFSSVEVARQFIVPALVGGVATGEAFGEVVTWAFLILAVPALGYAAAKYLLFRYRLAGDELIIDSGVFSRRHRVLPLERVQNIDVRQSTFQRLFGVAELRIETASGGNETEARLSVLSQETAESLRAEVGARRRGLAKRGIGEAGERPPEPAATTIAHLSTADLALAGATANKAGLIAVVLGGAFQLLPDLPLESWLAGLPIARIDPSALPAQVGLPPATFFALAALAAAVLFLIVGWLLSIAGAIVGYHGFTLERRGEELHKEYGLFARREGVVPLERVQAIRIEESLLRRPFGLAALKIETAGAAPGRNQSGGAEAFVPLARAGELPGLVASVFDHIDYDALRFHPVHPRARRRLVSRYATPVALAAAALTVLVGPDGLLLLVLLPLAWLLARAQYRNRGYALTDGYAVARGGWWNRITWIVPNRRVQTLQLRETPFQRRLGLATLHVDTAAGAREGAAVVDLGREEAVRVVGELAERVRGAAGGVTGPSIGPS